MISSLSKSYTLILIAIPIAIILSIIFMLVIRFTAGCFVYILIFFAIGALVAIGLYLVLAPVSSTGASNGYVTLLSNRPVCIIIAVLCFILAAAILVMVCCFKKRISLAASIIKVAARFVDENLGVLCLPIILFAVMILFLTLWILEALGYYSLGTPISEP